ncbi:MAG: hypothetical protein M3378_06735 [Actinomycetota bacterium]|nr:hypothetical protein [Actinomycetota bacterium]
MTRFRRAALVAVLGILVVAGPAIAHVRGGSRTESTSARRSATNAAAGNVFEIGVPDCGRLLPAALPTTLTSSVRLDVTVLVDGSPAIDPRRVLSAAAQSYRPLGISLNPTYRRVSFTGASAPGLLQQARSLLGGRRPAGSDVVLVLTDKDIDARGNKSVAGLADCVGGVAFANRAFAVSEVFAPDTLAVGPVTLSANLSAKVAAHEIGHLLGAEHHFANCVEGILSELTQLEVSPCTLMFNSVDAASLNFSTVNGQIVRGQAEAYAR